MLLKRFRAVVGEGAAEVNVVKNWGLIPVGTLAPWTYFDDSETAKAVTESDGRIMEYPPLAMRVARQLVNRRLSIARALELEPEPILSAGERMVLEGWWRKASKRARSGTRHGEIESVAETRGLARITEELTGQPPTASQLQLLGKAIRAVGLRPDDPLLPLFVALGYHQRLYEEIPGKVAAAAKEATEESKSAVNAAARETVATLVKEVGKSAQAITKNVAAAEQRRWRSELLYRTSITTLIMLLLWLIAFGAGYVLAQKIIRMQQPEVAWLQSPDGQLVQEMYADGRIEWLLSEAGQRARERSGDGSIKWLDSREGQRARQLSADGTIEYIVEHPAGARMHNAARNPTVADYLVDMLNCSGENGDGQPWEVHEFYWCRSEGMVYWPYVPEE